MKTAMQEAIEKIENCFDWDETKEMLNNLLEKEKMQIRKAYSNGYENSKNYVEIGNEDYFNETYN